MLPAGLGCRDTLRFEANLPLYGNELNDTTTPIEAGYAFFVDVNTDFIGKDVLAEQKVNGVKQKIIGFQGHIENILTNYTEYNKIIKYILS